MTVRQVLHEGYQSLLSMGVDTPVLDATVLLSEALGLSKERLLADLPETVPPDGYATFRRFLDLRREGLPVSYIRGKKEFYGLEFYVDARVLVPRPETETLVETVIELAREEPGLRLLHDACTGSGCIAIACARALGELALSVSDICEAALEVCQLNARHLLGRELDATVSDLLASVQGPFDIVTANPPYLTDSEVAAMRATGWPEAELALAGGPDGTAPLGRLVLEARGKLRAGGRLLAELAPSQAGRAAFLLEQAGYESVHLIRDLAGRDRVVTGRWPG